MKHYCALCDKELVAEPCLQRHASNYIALYPERFVCIYCTTYEIAAESKYQMIYTEFNNLPLKGLSNILEEVVVIEESNDISYKIINDYFRKRSTIIHLKRVQPSSIRLFEPTDIGNYPLIQIDFRDLAKTITRIKTFIIFT